MLPDSTHLYGRRHAVPQGDVRSAVVSTMKNGKGRGRSAYVSAQVHEHMVSEVGMLHVLHALHGAPRSVHFLVSRLLVPRNNTGYGNPHLTVDVHRCQNPSIQQVLADESREQPIS